jgi:hypothetical protein
MVVADPRLEAGRGRRGLNTPDETIVGQDAERIVHGLARDGTDLRPDDFSHAVGRDVGLALNGAQHSQALRRHLDSVLPKQVTRVKSHAARLIQ